MIEIHGSARKHGVADSDIRHAITYAFYWAELKDDRLLYLGPNRAGNPLEIIGIIRRGDSETLLVIHAMPMRAKFRALLRKERS